MLRSTGQKHSKIAAPRSDHQAFLEDSHIWMNPLPCATTQTICTRVSHTIRTVTVRVDLVGWVISGRKRLSTPHGEKLFSTNDVFLIPRSTQWDVINEAAAGGNYQARIISFSPQLLEQFFERFGQFAATPVLRSCAGTKADETFIATFTHTLAALEDSLVSDAVREHRAQEILLLLAERGLVFTPQNSLTWTDRVHRLVGNAPSSTGTWRTFRTPSCSAPARFGADWRKKAPRSVCACEKLASKLQWSCCRVPTFRFQKLLRVVATTRIAVFLLHFAGALATYRRTCDPETSLMRQAAH